MTQCINILSYSSKRAHIELKADIGVSDLATQNTRGRSSSGGQRAAAAAPLSLCWKMLGDPVPAQEFPKLLPPRQRFAKATEEAFGPLAIALIEGQKPAHQC
jgi:hypothetical protein